MNFLLSFFFLQKNPPPHQNYYSYYIDIKFEEICYTKIDFVPARTSYRVTQEEFDELTKGIRIRAHNYFAILRIIKLFHFLITLCCIIYLILYFAAWNTHPFSYVLFTILMWVLLKIITRIFRMKFLRKSQKVIELYFHEINHSIYHRRGLQWKVTSYAQYLELNLNYNPYHDLSLSMKSRFSSEFGYPTSPHQMSILIPLLERTSPHKSSQASVAKSTRSYISQNF